MGGNLCIKTIAQPETIKKYIQVHHPHYKIDAIDTIGRIVPEWESEEMTEYMADPYKPLFY